MKTDQKLTPLPGMVHIRREVAETFGDGPIIKHSTQAAKTTAQANTAWGFITNAADDVKDTLPVGTKVLFYQHTIVGSGKGPRAAKMAKVHLYGTGPDKRYVYPAEYILAVGE